MQSSGVLLNATIVRAWAAGPTYPAHLVSLAAKASVTDEQRDSACARHLVSLSSSSWSIAIR